MVYFHNAEEVHHQMEVLPVHINLKIPLILDRVFARFPGVV